MLFRPALDMALEAMKQERWDDALKVLNGMLAEKLDDPWLLFLTGTCHMFKENDGVAFALLMRAMERKQDFFECMVNLASILRRKGMWREEELLWKEVQRISPDDPRALHNLAGLYLNNATPQIAEQYARKNIAVEGDRPDNLIQLGLALLEQEKWGNGFDALDSALKLGERKSRNFWGLGQTPMWDGTPGLNVMVYGEQGHGDEIMFASCMNEAISRCKRVYVDTCKGNMVALLERSFPEAVVISTPDSQLRRLHTDLKIDAMVAFGSLPTLFRREESDFPRHKGYLKASPAKSAMVRGMLDELGPRPKIGIAWRGGIPRTQSYLRHVPIEAWSPILKQDADFISVQYTKDAEDEASFQEDRTGVRLHHWQGIVDDFDMLTALIGELDLVISVPQTAVHQRAALGKECWVIAHHKAPWPFGLTRDSMVWYPEQTRIFRRAENDENYNPVVLRVAQALSKRFTKSSVDPFIPVPAQAETFELVGVR